MRFKLVVLTSTVYAALVAAKTVQYSLSLSNKVIAPDGYSRSAVLADGVFPGPLVQGNKGDILEIEVDNYLSDSRMLNQSTVHWHGIHMHGTNWADGTEAITQCAIPERGMLKHVLDLTKETGSGQVGTFWYHSHLSSQYCDGLRGPLVIYDDDDPITYNYDIDDESTIISLADWYHVYGPSFHPGNKSYPLPDATLINGKGYSFTNGTSGGLSVITVQQGKRYRMRVIQMSCQAIYTYSVDGHPMEIIEADSLRTQPLVVDSFKIFPGQRYSYILDANQPVGNYWMRSLPSPNRQIKNFNYSNNAHVAILQYAGAENMPMPPPADINVPILNNTLVENELKPLTSGNAPGPAALGSADLTFNITTVFNNVTNLFYLNGQTFQGPTVPILQQILRGQKPSIPSGTVYQLPKDKVVEITLQGTSGDNGGQHPFHLHGHDFYLVKSSSSSSPNFVNPIQRDTASAGDENTSMTIRFKTDNPGPWFFHCHIDWHLEMGMGIVFVEDLAGVNATDLPPKDWQYLCPEDENENLPTEDP